MSIWENRNPVRGHSRRPWCGRCLKNNNLENLQTKERIIIWIDKDNLSFVRVCVCLSFCHRSIYILFTICIHILLSIHNAQCFISFDVINHGSYVHFWILGIFLECRCRASSLCSDNLISEIFSSFDYFQFTNKHYLSVFWQSSVESISSSQRWHKKVRQLLKKKPPSSKLPEKLLPLPVVRDFFSERLFQ